MVDGPGIVTGGLDAAGIADGGFAAIEVDAVNAVCNLLVCIHIYQINLIFASMFNLGLT